MACGGLVCTLAGCPSGLKKKSLHQESSASWKDHVSLLTYRREILVDQRFAGAT